MSKIVQRRQLAILEFIYNYVNQKGYPPTVREILVFLGNFGYY